MTRFRASLSLLLALLLVPLTAGTALGDEPYVIEPGQEALLQSMLSPAEGLPEGFAFKGAQIAKDHVVATYTGPDGEIKLRLGHPKTGGEGALITVAFAITGEAPKPLLDAIAASIEKQGSAWRWFDRTAEPPPESNKGEKRIIELLEQKLEKDPAALEKRVEEIESIAAELQKREDVRWVGVEIGHLFLRAGDKQKADSYFSGVLKALAETPSSSVVGITTAARAHVSLGKTDKALAAVDKGWPPADRIAEACTFAEVEGDMLRLGHVAAGLELCGRIVKAVPKCEHAYLVLRHLLAEGKELQKAREILKQGAAALPESDGIKKLIKDSTPKKKKKKPVDDKKAAAQTGGSSSWPLMVGIVAVLLLGVVVVVRRRKGEKDK